VTEVRRAVVCPRRINKGVEVTCPWCNKTTPRADAYFGSGKQTFRCNYCHRPYRVRFAGKKTTEK
jgi:transposase-like protein